MTRLNDNKITSTKDEGNSETGSQNNEHSSNNKSSNSKSKENSMFSFQGRFSITIFSFFKLKIKF